MVTVLFGDLSGFTELAEKRDAEEVKRIVDRAFEGLAEIVTLYGGRIDKIIGDEIMAVFGAPVAHEDDAERAVRAALEIQRALAKYSEDLERTSGIGLQMHIGLNTGEVVAGFVGGSDSYTVVGDVVNTARRIEDAAEAGQILVGAATYEATRGAIEYRGIGKVTAKGKRLPVEVWEALTERGLPGERAVRAAPLIGREEELSLLESLARIVRRDRRPAAVTIVGDAGMGKSRVAAEFARRMTMQGVQVLGGRSLPYGTASPAFAVEEIVRAALGLDPGMEAEAARGVIRERLGALGLTGDSDRIATLLGVGGSVTARDVPATGPAAASAPAAGTSALLEAARAVLERVAESEGLLVLVFHELHWAGDAVLDFVESLVRAARAPLLVAGLARASLLERRPGWTGSAPRISLLTLDPLPREGAEQLLDILAPTLGSALRESVLERAGGNPFYLEELARLLVEREDVGESTIPVGLHALVTARIDALPADAKRTLQDAAVVGEQFWPGAVRALGGMPEEQLVAGLRALVTADFIEETASMPLDGDAALRFRQTIVRDVAYGSVPKRDRASQHLTVAGWFETVAGDDPTPRAPLDDLIAYHFERAALLALEVGTSLPDAERKARAFLERAGRSALGLDAAATAADFFERALGFATDDADALAVRIQLGEALLGSWRPGPAEQHLTTALQDAQRQGDRGREGKALRLLGDLFRMRGEPDRAREPLERALMIAKETGDAREEAEGLRSHGLLDLHRGRWSAAVLWFRQALARYRHPMLGDPRGEGWSLQNLGWANLLLGRFDEALAALDEGGEVFLRLGDEEGVGWCLSLRGWVLLMRGEIAEASRIAEELEAHLLSQPGGSEGFEASMQVVLRAYGAVLRGRLDDAQALADRVLKGSPRVGAGWVDAMAMYPSFVAAMLSRRFGLARRRAEAGAAAAAASGDPLYEGQFAFARAWLALEEGRPQEAERLIERQTATGEAGQMWADSASTRWLRARVLLAIGQATEARRLLEAEGRLSITIVPPAFADVLLAQMMLDEGDAAGAAERARTAAEAAGEQVIARAHALRVLARALLAAGDSEGAHAAITRELALLEETDLAVERVRALATLAPILDALRRHDESADTLDRARALIEALPAGTDTQPLHELLLV